MKSLRLWGLELRGVHGLRFLACSWSKLSLKPQARAYAWNSGAVEICLGVKAPQEMQSTVGKFA